ncbi:MAG: hypothetical protein IT464_01095 [Planctomycetes bacterium]|nr:hypothetical protein [Planctomycetota bacterium]
MTERQTSTRILEPHYLALKAIAGFKNMNLVDTIGLAVGKLWSETFPGTAMPQPSPERKSRKTYKPRSDKRRK